MSVNSAPTNTTSQSMRHSAEHSDTPSISGANNRQTHIQQQQNDNNGTICNYSNSNVGQEKSYEQQTLNDVNHMPHRMRCKENLIDCLNVSGAIKSGPKNDVRILNVNECENNTVEKFKSNLHSNAKYLKMVHFNAQGLLEALSTYVR